MAVLARRVSQLVNFLPACYHWLLLLPPLPKLSRTEHFLELLERRVFGEELPLLENEVSSVDDDDDAWAEESSRGTKI
eukprot:3197491-Amphidinium_carterae.1